MTTATFNIGGMHCAACAVRNERTLRKFKGVLDATVNFATRLPMSLGLATPTAIMVGTGMGAESGILIKNGEALERGKKIDVVVFDKTGTLTDGKPRVTEVAPLKRKKNPDDVLALAASVETQSEHPLAKAIVRAARDKNLPLRYADHFENLSGKGVRGTIGGTPVMVGSCRFLLEQGVPLIHDAAWVERHDAEAKTVMFIAQDDALIGVIAVADALKDDARAAIDRLHREGIKTMIMTGDNRLTAEAIAAQAGVDRVFAEILSGDKASRVKELQAQGQRVAFVGDGINDAPALVQADLGIAIGTGTDIAIEAGNIVLVKGNPIKVVEALALSQRTFRAIRQNLFWAFFYNIAAIPLAAIGLLNPMIAAAAMACSSLTVVGNSLRIRNLKLS